MLDGVSLLFGDLATCGPLDSSQVEHRYALDRALALR